MPKVIETVNSKVKMQTGFSGLLDQHSLIPIASCYPGGIYLLFSATHSYSILFPQDLHFFNFLLSKENIKWKEKYAVLL